jgi:hypothetical protein
LFISYALFSGSFIFGFLSNASIFFGFKCSFISFGLFLSSLKTFLFFDGFIMFLPTFSFYFLLFSNLGFLGSSFFLSLDSGLGFSFFV